MSKCLSIALMLTVANVQAKEPIEGWFMSGANPGGYYFELEPNDGRPAPSGHLASNKDAWREGFGTIMQSFYPEQYLGKRVQLTAWVKSKNVKDWAGLWMRVDDSDKPASSFDNMQDRPIKGDTDWRQYSIVLDVSQTAQKLSYGALISGAGEVWIDEFEFTEVTTDVPQTGTITTLRNRPINNSF